MRDSGLGYGKALSPMTSFSSLEPSSVVPTTGMLAPLTTVMSSCFGVSHDEMGWFSFFSPSLNRLNAGCP